MGASYRRRRFGRHRQGCGPCRSGLCPRKRFFRVKRFLVSTAYGAMGPSYRKRRFGRHRQGCGPCRSGPCPRKRFFRVKRFLVSTAFGAMGPSYRKRRFGRHRQGCGPCRSGPCPRKRFFRVKRFLASTAFGGMAPSYRNRRDRQRIHGGYTRGSPLVGTPRGHAAAGHRPERRPMAAKASVPVDPLPGHQPLSRAWPAPTTSKTTARSSPP
jgi:hypothetical protein